MSPYSREKFLNSIVSPLILMKQKEAFAIFVGAIMVLSAFAGFAFRGGGEGNVTIAAAPTSLDAFGMQGRLVDWSFDSLEDALKISPESTVSAYWVDLDKSDNLTDLAKAGLPKSYGLEFGDRPGQIYPNKIQTLAVSYFNNSFVEFHWVTPFQIGYDGLVVPYQDYMIIPSAANMGLVAGKPMLFGPQSSLKSVVDVVTGGLPTDKFTLPVGEKADLQAAYLGGAANAPLGGGYKEFYLGANDLGTAYSLDARYLDLGASGQKVKDLSTKFGLNTTTRFGVTELKGTIERAKLKDALMSFTAP
jgi:hypothetical protein